MPNAPKDGFLEPFVAPELKIERARYHYAAMIETLIDYQSRAQPTFVKTERAKEPWQIEIREPVPSVVSLQIGDLAHSLRSSLDVMLCDIALVKGKGLSDMVYPFAENEACFESMLEQPNRKQPFKKLGTEVVDVIKRSRPFGGGNALLRGLHDLNNHDKHRMAVPIASFISATGNFKSALGEQAIVAGGQLIGLGVGEPLPFIDGDADPTSEYTINPTSMIITFPKGYVLQGNVITELGTLIDYVDGLLTDLRTAALACPLTKPANPSDVEVG